MLRAFLLRKLDASERYLGESVEYLRHVLRVSLRAFLKFALFTPLAGHRRTLAPTPYHVARIVATRHEDCGTCLQIEVNMAKKDGVPPELLRIVLAGRPQELPADLADVYRFSEAVVKATYEEDDLRERIRKRYGEEAFVELALAIATCRVFPVTKRALGYAKSCARVEIRA